MVGFVIQLLWVILLEVLEARFDAKQLNAREFNRIMRSTSKVIVMNIVCLSKV